MGSSLGHVNVHLRNCSQVLLCGCLSLISHAPAPGMPSLQLSQSSFRVCGISVSVECLPTSGQDKLALHTGTCLQTGYWHMCPCRTAGQAALVH